MTWAGHQIITQAKNKPGMMDDSSHGEAENEHRETKTDFSSSLIGLHKKSENLIKPNKGIKRPQQQLSPNRSVIPKILPKVMPSQNGHLEVEKSNKVDSKLAFDVLFSVAKSNLPIHLDEENHSSRMLKKRVDGQDFEITRSIFTEGVSPRKYPEEDSDNDGKVREKKNIAFCRKTPCSQKLSSGSGIGVGQKTTN
jgi:hypothetical protein